MVKDKTKSGYVITLINTGNVKETFTVAQDQSDIPNSPFTVPAGETIHVLLPLTEDQTAAISIAGKVSGFTLDKTVTLDCLPPPVVPAPTSTSTTSTSTTSTSTSTSTTVPAPEVEAEQIDRPELAKTGFSVIAWLAFGTSLLILGFGVVRAARSAGGN